MEVKFPHYSLPEILRYYYNNLDNMTPRKGLKIQKVDVSLCTHLYYGFIVPNPDASIEIDPFEEIK